MEEKLNADLQELIDRQRIHQVMIRYARGLDRSDRELTRSCYWDDAVDDHAHYVGVAGDFVVWAEAVTNRHVTAQHAILNHHCELAGNEAFCETYFQFTGTLPEPPHFSAIGRYVDHMQKRQGEWRIANRVTIFEGSFDLSEAARERLSASPYSADEPCQAARDRRDVSYHRPPVPRRPVA